MSTEFDGPGIVKGNDVKQPSPAVATAPVPPAGPPARRPGRALAVLAVLAALAAGGVVVAMRGGSDDPAPAPKAPLFTTSTREVVYEVSGDSPVDEIEYVVGAGNKLEIVKHPTLPWSKEVTLPVGRTGGTALVNAANAGPGKLACVVKVDGQDAYQVAGQKETDVSCSTGLAPATVPAE